MSLNPLALSSPFCFAPSKGNYFLFSVSESVSVELYSIYFHIPHINENIYYLSFFVWLISLIIILSRPIHVAANGETSFRFMTEECFIVCVCAGMYLASSLPVHLWGMNVSVNWGTLQLLLYLGYYK